MCTCEYKSRRHVCREMKTHWTFQNLFMQCTKRSNLIGFASLVQLFIHKDRCDCALNLKWENLNARSHFPRSCHWSVNLCSHAAGAVEVGRAPEKMVGLRNRSSWEPLLLKASCIKSCANGCSLGITANLTYANADVESVEGEWGGGIPSWNR